MTGSYVNYYVDLVKALRREKELMVKPEQSRDGVKIMEIARESVKQRRTLPFN